ncbi:MAG: hypothetical protein IJM31_01700 [Campylobacter sp.]|nr:hypothetical protein [Campylobacter sp.]
MQNKFFWREILKGAVCLPFFSALIYSVLSTIKTPQETIFAKILAFILTFPLNLGVIFFISRYSKPDFIGNTSKFTQR